LSLCGWERERKREADEREKCALRLFTIYISSINNCGTGVSRDLSDRLMKIFHVLVALLFISLFVGLVEARGGTFIISPGGEVIEKIQLSPTDSVFGNMSVSGGFVDFYVTSPSNELIYQNLKTSIDHFNFTAEENGTFEMIFANEYQFENVSVSLSYSVNFFIFVSEEIHVSTYATQTTTSNGIIITQIQPHPYIVLSVNPPGFPVEGQFWQISVFSENQSSDEVTYLSPLPNATVLVTVIVNNQPTVYNSTTDEDGHLEFQFLTQYSDISFQAISGGNESDIIGFTQQAEHNVSADTVDFTYNLSILMSGITALSVVVLHFAKKIRIIFSWLIGAVLCLSLVQLVISVIARYFWLTPWGYAENIFGSLTWTSMRYVAVVSIMLYAFLVFAVLYLGLRNPERSVSS
jgi:hypothetical protein